MMLSAARDFRALLIRQVASLPADYARHLDAEVARWTRVVRESGAKAE